jgi:F0F1-type ATP synthase membrane subunit b/b'
VGQDPEQLRADIAQTRAEFDEDLNTLGEKVSPGKIAERRVEATKGAIMGVKDKVMGSADSARSGSGAGGGALSSLTDGVSGAPDAVQSKAAGNPMAAGLIAFGIGWLASSLLPASDAEQQAASKVKDALQEPVTAQLKTTAAEVQEELQPAVQEAAETLKSSATDAVGEVREQAADAQQSVKHQASTSASTLKDTAQDAKDQVQNEAGSANPR